MKLRCVFLLLCTILWGCSSASDNSVILDASGKHPVGWVVAVTGGNHPASYRANQSICIECHGSAQVASASGGISGVSCFSASRSGISCHPAGPSGHPAGWSAPASHGSAAKATPDASHGFSYCTQCHGTDYVSGTGTSCKTCHTSAPHPSAPWRGTTASGTTHTTSDPGNASECSRCHAGGVKLTTPVAALAGATCFNNTLCHGAVNGHPAGWSAPTSHGSAAKATPDASHGFSYCTQCHGTDYVSGTGTSCKSCHTSAPHPVAPWRGTTASGTTHITTDPGNASECSRCHAGGVRLTTPVAASAGATCFNNTLCHGSTASHAFPNPGSLHKSSTSGCSSCHAIGTSASIYPVATSTPPDCKSCHKLSAATNMAQMTGCSDCHGDAATGRPSGTVFPNIRGRHSSPSEHAAACTVCHSGGGSGFSAHGNSNSVVKTAANVILNGTASGMNIVRSSGSGVVTCTGTCHGEVHNGRTW